MHLGACIILDKMCSLMPTFENTVLCLIFSLGIIINIRIKLHGVFLPCLMVSPQIHPRSEPGWVCWESMRQRKKNLALSLIKTSVGWGLMCGEVCVCLPVCLGKLESLHD